MSIERLLAENTMAIVGLTNAIQGKVPAEDIPQQANTVTAGTVVKPKAVAKAKPKATAKPKGIEYSEIQKATIALANAKDEATVIQILNDFGVTHAQNLTQDQWMPYLVAVEKAMKAPTALA